MLALARHALLDVLGHRRHVRGGAHGRVRARRRVGDLRGAQRVAWLARLHVRVQVGRQRVVGAVHAHGAAAVVQVLGEVDPRGLRLPLRRDLLAHLVPVAAARGQSHDHGRQFGLRRRRHGHGLGLEGRVDLGRRRRSRGRRRLRRLRLALGDGPRRRRLRRRRRRRGHTQRDAVLGLPYGARQALLVRDHDEVVLVVLRA